MLVDGPTSLGARARSRRQALLNLLFPDISRYRVLDLGGTAYSWLDGDVRPASVTLLNVVEGELTVREARQDLPDWLELVAGDACDPPKAVRDGDFDLVFSNSVIEHVGGPARRVQLADVVRSCAPRHWVQTPYRYFPLEPHWLFPGFQFLPLAARSWLSSRWPLVHTKSSSWSDSVSTALGTELLSATEMRYLFPDSELRRESALGLTKSLIAVKR